MSCRHVCPACDGPMHEMGPGFWPEPGEGEQVTEILCWTCCRSLRANMLWLSRRTALALLIQGRPAGEGFVL